ncbi:hypothetical protein H671_4g11714 [Cricetulus griseus]|uniref:Uncharacterized protein n=1 Tax=Cricetulus griseus TaxID=10029 RepID=A0A061I4N9_CRIGR|nr:hypothetical protein H671_4g11714 [Cricetulus griseus]
MNLCLELVAIHLLQLLDGSVADVKSLHLDSGAAILSNCSNMQLGAVKKRGTQLPGLMWKAGAVHCAPAGAQMGGAVEIVFI